MGEGYWRQEPAQGYLDRLGCGLEEFTNLAEFESLGAAQGLFLESQEVATEEDWKAYEGTYAANMRTFLSTHPQDPEAEDFQHRLQAWTEGVARWGQSTLGFAASLYRKPD